VGEEIVMEDDLFFDEEDGEDDLFDDFGGEDDPFAALDEAFADDPFRELEATPEREGYVEVPEYTPAPAPQPVEPPQEEDDDDTPAWLRELGVGEDEFGYIEPEQSAPPPEPVTASAAPGPLAAVTGTGSEGSSFGLTARQRMLLALFLLLDVGVLACGLLYALGAINF
jgi:hypothetical protein